MKKKGERKAAHAASYIRAESFPPTGWGLRRPRPSPASEEKEALYTKSNGFLELRWIL